MNAPPMIPPPARFSLHRIIVPIDFSEPSANALNAAAELAEKFQAELCLVHVVPALLYAEYLAAYQPATPVIDFSKMNDGALREAEIRLGPLVEELTQRGLKARAVARSGDVAQEILDFAGLESADLIVIATHGHSGIKRFVLGSVTERLIRHAACPVFVVRLKTSDTP